MRTCRLVLSRDELREKLGLPEGVVVRTLGALTSRHNMLYFVLEGIGPDLNDGATLSDVSGKLKLRTDGTLEWAIT